MEERRSNGFRVKPSFGQVLGYIQEGEPLTLDLPNRKASIYTSSHFYLDDYPNAPEPVSETPLPHTSLNPAAAFETADEGYSGTPFPRPPREFTRPSFLPDSDDGGMDPGQALRNDGLNPPRPPTLGGRMRESGIQAAEAIVAGGGTDSDASRPSHATDVQTLNGMQESGAIDHFYAQEQRRRQQPQVFRIDTTESEGEPQVQPQQQIRARPVRRPRAQPTPFGINQVPIPVSSGSERVSRQSRGDRGPLGSQPSFDALRQASEPEAA